MCFLGIFSYTLLISEKHFQAHSQVPWCKKIGEMIDEPTLHPHDFRHSGATLLKNAGMSLEDVSSLLNHAGTDVTNKYYIKKDTTKIQSAKDRFEI